MNRIIQTYEFSFVRSFNIFFHYQVSEANTGMLIVIAASILLPSTNTIEIEKQKKKVWEMRIWATSPKSAIIHFHLKLFHFPCINDKIFPFFLFFFLNDARKIFLSHSKNTNFIQLISTRESSLSLDVCEWEFFLMFSVLFAKARMNHLPIDLFSRHTKYFI